MSTPNQETETPAERRSVPQWLRHNLRWQLPLVLLVGTTIMWIDRSNLGVAASDIRSDLGISASQMGVVLGVHSLVLAAAHPFWAWFIDKRRSPRLIYFWSLIGAFAASAAISLVRGVAALFALRVLIAGIEAPQSSCSLKATSKWFPRRERALAIGTYEVGSEFGGAIGVPIAVALIAALGWRWSFVATASFGLFFALFWLWFYRDPETHRRITPEEYGYLETGGAHLEPKQFSSTDEPSPAESAQEPPPAVRWSRLLRYRTVWGLIAVMFCRTSVAFFFITWYPTYLVEERGFSLLELGVYGAIPGIAAIGGDLVGGWYSDHLVRRGASLTTARKRPIVMGLLGGTAIGLAAVVDSPAGALTLLSISASAVAFCTGALYSMPLEVAPAPGNAVSISGLMRSGGLLGGFVTPILIGFQFDATGSFVPPLLTTAGMLVLAMVFLVTVVGKVEPLWTERSAAS